VGLQRRNQCKVSVCVSCVVLLGRKIRNVNEDFLSSYTIVNCTIICMYEGNTELI